VSDKDPNGDGKTPPVEQATPPVDRHLATLALSARLRRMQTSLSWRATKPLRDLGGLYHKYVMKCTRLDLLPVHELDLITRNNKVIWVSRGGDPQFLLTALNPAVMSQGGWFSLEFDFACRQPAEQCLYIDYGDGFQPDIVVTHHVERRGAQALVFYLPRGTKALRFDPATQPCEFSLEQPVLRKLGAGPTLQGVNGFLKCCETSEFTFVASQQVERRLHGEFHYRSQGTDPAFVVRHRQGRELGPGWCRIDFTIVGEYQHQVAKLYVDFGEGFSEQHAYPIPFESGVASSRVIWLERGVSTLRFDPWEREGVFRVEGFCVDNITGVQAATAIASRLVQHSEAYRDTAPADILGTDGSVDTLEDGDAERREALYADYAETFVIDESELSYQKWIDEVERKAQPTAETVSSFVAAQSTAPVISVLVPVYNPDAALLTACIQSVIDQSYPHWELCLADDASPDAHVVEVLRQFEKRDPRIKVHVRPENGHISRTTNDALAMASGDYIALLDHDDVLAPHAFYFVARELAKRPGLQLIYSDEDKIDIHGTRCEPHFKPDWNLDLLYSQNYVSHLGVYRKQLVDRIGGFREGVEGSQDYDLVLRCIPHLHDDKIVHIPQVLYHWRAIEGSTALAEEGKDYTTSAGIQALCHHFEELGVTGVDVLQGLVANTYRVSWPIPDPAPLVSMLIPTRDKKEVTELAVRSILDKSTYTNFEIIILDNGSVEPETHEFFDAIQDEDERIRVVQYDHPFNYSAINNYGARLANGSIIGLVNNDVEVISPEWLTEMVSHVLRDDVGCVGAKLYFGNDTIQHAGVVVGLGGVAGHSHKHFPRSAGGYFNRLKVVQSVSAVTAACLLVRKSVYDEVGGLNENDLKVAFNDVDFCLKVLSAGYRNIWTPFAELYHHESISRGAEDSPEKVARFNTEVDYMKRTWSRIIDHDPSYSPCLTKSREDFSIGNR